MTHSPRRFLFGRAVGDAVCDVLVEYLERARTSNVSVNASSIYLKRADVRRQVHDTLMHLAADDLQPRLRETFGIVYFDIDVYKNGSFLWRLSLLPCASCACVSVSDDVEA